LSEKIDKDWIRGVRVGKSEKKLIWEIQWFDERRRVEEGEGEK